eukprot:m.172749 g.172749  ORF g.172749 m.172749 type:complete len:819 (+) comp39086_c1_seq14:357-2813(+)
MASHVAVFLAVVFVFAGQRLTDASGPALHRCIDVVQAIPGSEFDLSCPIGDGEATGINSWKWRRNFAKFEPSACGSAEAEESRLCLQENGALLFLNARPQDSGYFRCFAQSGLKPLRSRVFKVEIRSEEDLPLLLDDSPGDVSAVSGSKMVSFRCLAIGGPHLKVTWSRLGDHGSVLSLRPNHKVTNENTLRIFDVTSKDHGQYACTAENQFGSLAKSVQLTVHMRHSSGGAETPQTNPPLKVVAIPKDTTAFVGGQALFDCQFQGDPNVAIIWYKDREVNQSNPDGTIIGAQIDVILFNKYETLYNHSLLIWNVTHDDQRKYTCQIYSGTSQEFSANLYVEDEPLQPVVDTEEPGIQLPTTTPPVDVTEPPPVAVTGIPDGVPQNVEVSVNGPTTLAVSWQYQGSGDLHRRATDFRIRFQSEEEGFKECKGPSTACTVTKEHGLKTFTDYSVSVAASNSKGLGSYSEVVQVKSGEAAPGPPSDVKVVTKKDESTMTVTWQPPLEPNGIITGYKVIYTTDGGRSRSEKSFEATDRSATISKLIVDQSYEVVVLAVTKAGDGAASTSHKITVGEASSTKFTETPYFYVIVALGAIVGLALLILVIVCIRRGRSGEMDVSKVERRPRPKTIGVAAHEAGAGGSYSYAESLNNSVQSPPPYPEANGGARFFPPPPARAAPTPAASSAVPSVQSAFSPRHVVTSPNTHFSPRGSLDHLKYGYAADGPDLEPGEGYGPPIPTGRPGGDKRLRHGSKQGIGMSSFGTTGDIDSMTDTSRYSVEYSPGDKPRTGSMRTAEAGYGGKAYAYRPKMMPQGHSKQSQL